MLAWESELCVLAMWPNNGCYGICLFLQAGKNQAIVDIRLRPRSGVAPWWVSLSIRHCDKSTLLPIESLLRRLFMAIMYKHDVVHTTGST